MLSTNFKRLLWDKLVENPACLVHRATRRENGLSLSRPRNIYRCENQENGHHFVNRIWPTLVSFQESLIASLRSSRFLYFFRWRGRIEQASGQAGERTSAPGVRKKCGILGSGWGEKESPLPLPLLLIFRTRSQFHSYLYSRLRDGNGCAARTKEPECLMPSKYHTKFNIITKE